MVELSNDHEYGNGQFEQNFSTPTLSPPPTALFLPLHGARNSPTRRAWLHVHAQTLRHLTGADSHPPSLWSRDGAELFLDRNDHRGLGLSEMAYHYSAV